jgi:hypothetical protein
MAEPSTFEDAVSYCGSTINTGLNGSSIASFPNENDFSIAQELLITFGNNVSKAFVGLTRVQPLDILTKSWKWNDGNVFDFGSLSNSFSTGFPVNGDIAMMDSDFSGKLIDDDGSNTSEWVFCQAPCTSLPLLLVSKCDFV